MVITIVLISAIAIAATIIATVIHQKALAYRTYRCDEDALGDVPLRSTQRAGLALQRSPTRLRTAALARRKAANACGHHAYS
jgi:hypothetical protein